MPAPMEEQYESKLKKLIRDEISEAVQISVDKAVNGKIINLTKIVNDYIEMDTKWKETAQPTINFATESAGFIKIGKYIVVGLTAIGAFIVTLYQAIKIISH